MIATHTDCPPIEMLERLGSETLPEVDFAAIESHVQGCPQCQSALECLSADVMDCEETRPTIPGFVIERELGRGGMGVVYQARQPELARRVALKVLTHGPADRKRWIREARAMGQVRHPNIVRLHQVGEESGRFFLVLDLIPAGSLKERVTGPIAPAVAASLIETIARAVAHIHAAGMLHLDIKPSNILLDGPPGGPLGEAVPVLADFGLARAVDDANETAVNRTGAGIAPGTPAFMAPEQVDGHAGSFGPQTDVFALGCTLYALLTGRSPFQGSSVVETLDLVRSRDPVPPRNLVPGISRDLETIVLQCLRKDMRSRYASAADLADDLRRWLDGFPIVARPMGPAERTVRWCARSPAVASLLVFLAVTIAASLVSLAVLWRHSESERGRAEAALALAVRNEAVASRVRIDLIELLVGSLPEYRILTPDRTTEVMKILASQTKRLCDVRGLGATEVNTIAKLAIYLTNIFNFCGDREDSLAILEDALRLVEHHDRPGTRDRNLVIQHGRILVGIGSYCWELGHHERAIACFERGVAVGRDAGDVEACLDALTRVYDAIQTLAERALDKGDHASRERMVAAYSRMIESAADTFHPMPLFRLFLAASRSIGVRDVHGGGSRRSEIDRAFRAIRDEDRRGETFQYIVVTWMTYEAIPDSLLARAGDPGAPEECASRILATIDARCDEFGFPHELRLEIVDSIFQHVLQLATTHRHNGRYDRAEHAAHSLEILGRRLCTEEPSRAEYRLIVSAALEQNAKNAWRHDDRKLILSSLRGALAEAKVALRLRPDDPEIPVTICALQNKLIGLPVVGPSDK
ncbi:MAG: serine/threonine-protein kinase [Isosphaeraceae bacterium]